MNSTKMALLSLLVFSSCGPLATSVPKRSAVPTEKASGPLSAPGAYNPGDAPVRDPSVIEETEDSSVALKSELVTAAEYNQWVKDRKKPSPELLASGVYKVTELSAAQVQTLRKKGLSSVDLSPILENCSDCTLETAIAINADGTALQSININQPLMTLQADSLTLDTDESDPAVGNISEKTTAIAIVSIRPVQVAVTTAATAQAKQ